MRVRKSRKSRQLLSQFGNIASFELVKDANGDSKGYGFAVYEDPSVVDTACARLNGMMLGDKAITVQRSQRNDGGMGGGMGGGMATASVIQQAQQQVAMNMAMQTGVMPPGMAMPGGAPTRVVALDEMLDLNELSDQVTYDEIKEDMSDECANFGQITSLEIPRPSADGTPVPGLGKVFVEYANLEGSIKARTTLNGRKFGGKVRNHPRSDSTLAPSMPARYASSASPSSAPSSAPSAAPLSWPLRVLLCRWQRHASRQCMRRGCCLTE
jgi:splicing factor U2AF subunit